MKFINLRSNVFRISDIKSFHMDCRTLHIHFEEPTSVSIRLEYAEDLFKYLCDVLDVEAMDEAVG